MLAILLQQCQTFLIADLGAACTVLQLSSPSCPSCNELEINLDFFGGFFFFFAKSQALVMMFISVQLMRQCIRCCNFNPCWNITLKVFILKWIPNFFYILSLFLHPSLQRSISFRSESRTEIMPPRPWSRQAPAANTKRRDSKLWSETFDVGLGQMLSSKEIKRQEVRQGYNNDEVEILII